MVDVESSHPRAERCPICGSPIPLDRGECPRCSSPYAAPMAPIGSSPRGPSGRIFGAFASAIGVALISAALWFGSPGLVVVFAVPVGLAVLRYFWNVRHARLPDESHGVGRRVAMLLGSFAITWVVLFSAGIAFLATCVPCAFVLGGINDPLGLDGRVDPLMLAIICSAAAASSCAGFVGAFLWNDRIRK